MAKESFPKMPESKWWAIRERFKKTIPPVVDGAYISSLLDIKVRSAQTNIIPPLKQTGIIDDEGKPTPRANEWRDDASYPKVCKEIIKEVYPDDLSGSFSSPDSERSEIKRWFATKTGGGDTLTNMLTAFYTMLLEADPSKSKDALSTTPKKKRAKRTKTKDKKDKKKPDGTDTGEPNTHTIPLKNAPSIHLDVQIHISPEASPEQIDKIFASMSKHLKEFYRPSENK